MQEEAKKMRVIVVDDHATFCTAVVTLLDGHSGIEVVGQAHNGTEALQLAQVERPDLVLVDFNMPGMDGSIVARQLKAQSPAPKVVIMSFNSGPEYRELALLSGADAYLPKTDLHRELLPLLHRLRG